MCNLIFISDLHLSPHFPQKNEFFEKALNSWRGKIDALYMLGDIFDYWLADDDPAFAKNIETIKYFTKKTPIFMILGNHDFLICKQFANSTGVTIIPDTYIINLNGKKIMLSHGDRFCTKDIGYQVLKLIIQNKAVVKSAKYVSLKTKLRVKNGIEFIVNKGRKHPVQHHDPRYCLVDSSIQKLMNKKDATILIHGHTHRPNKYQIAPNLIRYELPDWHGQLKGGYLSYNNGNFKLYYGACELKDIEF